MPTAPQNTCHEGGARQQFVRWLVHYLPCPAEVRWHSNRVHLASASRRQGRLILRVHAAFAAGDAAVAEDLAAFLYRRERTRGARLKHWFDRHHHAQLPLPARLPAAPPSLHPAPPTPPHEARPAEGLAAAAAPATLPAAAPVVAGAADPFLQGLFDQLNAAYFHNGCRASVRWGRAKTPQRRRRRSIQLGCYDFVRQEIRLHPALREVGVPAYVVKMVVYHEMLHEVFGLEQRGSRRVAHPPEFRACEQSHPDYARARAWERQHLQQLLAWRA